MIGSGKTAGRGPAKELQKTFSVPNAGRPDADYQIASGGSRFDKAHRFALYFCPPVKIEDPEPA